MKKGYKNFLFITLLSIIIVSISCFIFENQKYELILLGKEEVTLTENEQYIEEGYVATNSKNKDVSNKVIIVSNVDYSRIGKYQIKYKIGKIEKIRRINIIKKEIDKQDISKKDEFVGKIIIDKIIKEKSYFNKNIYFNYDYIVSEELMPYGIFTPSQTNGHDKIPLIISLHGASERGCGEDAFRNKFLVKEFNNWEMSGFAAYIVMPHLAGNGYSTSWSNEISAKNLFDLIDYLINTLNIDTEKIIIQGQSLGGQGVLYMAAHERACFSAAVPVSGYPSNADLENIDCSIRGYVGASSAGEDSNSVNYMRSIFNNIFSINDLYERKVSHDQIPIVAFTEDLNEDNCSDLVVWMFEQ